jgi:hypothetical protein
VEVQISVGAVLVHRSRGHPDRAVSGGDPGSSAGGEGQHSAAGVDDLMVVMSMRVDCPAGRQPLGAGRAADTWRICVITWQIIGSQTKQRPESLV